MPAADPPLGLSTTVTESGAGIIRLVVQPAPSDRYLGS